MDEIYQHQTTANTQQHVKGVEILGILYKCFEDGWLDEKKNPGQKHDVVLAVWND